MDGDISIYDRFRMFASATMTVFDRISTTFSGGGRGVLEMLGAHT